MVSSRKVKHPSTNGVGAAQHRRLPSIPASAHQLIPIERHYDLLNSVLLPSFRALHSSGAYGVAYAVGSRFVEMALIDLPKHGYYEAKCENERAQSLQDALEIAEALADMARDGGGEEGIDEEEAKSLAALARSRAGKGGRELLPKSMGGCLGGWEWIDKMCEIPEHSTVSADRKLPPPPAAGLRAAQLAEDRSPTQDRDHGSIVSVDQKSSALIDHSAATKRDTGDVVQAYVRSERDGAAESQSTTAEELRPARAFLDADEERDPAPENNKDGNFPFDTVSTLAAEWESSLQSGQCHTALGPVKTADTIAPSSSQEGVEWGIKGRQEEIWSTVPSSFAESVYYVDDDEAERRAIADSRYEADLQQALRLSRLETGDKDQPVWTDGAGRGAEQATSPRSVGSSLATCSNQYHSDFDNLRLSGRVAVNFLDTYQGRIPGSTNGCTVIAPLLAIRHLNGEGEEVSEDRFDEITGSNESQLSEAEWIWDFEIDDVGTGTVHGTDRNDELVGIPSTTIEDVIDMEAPAILTGVRSRLNLSGHAFIVPSDVHDFLLEQKMLCQDQFLGVVGGNILDEDHLGNLVSMLAAGNIKGDRSTKRIAATLFFHEHVICLHRLAVGMRSRRRAAVKNLKEDIPKTEEMWFDIIDSLPSSRTFDPVSTVPDRVTQGSACVAGAQEERRDRYLPLTLMRDDVEVAGHGRTGGGATRAQPQQDEVPIQCDSSSQQVGEGGNEWTTNAVRIRCYDKDSLLSTLRWYACSKFTAEDRNYIDKYPWEDKKSDFDPRVFQAFLWVGGGRV